ncbi:MAG TPA: glycosyltransferase, partial [Dehalococcoidia bacterium]|nr:glycosyltransferase [Dehalococcoidia bacterium]
DKNVELILRATALVAQEAQVQTVIVGKGRDEAEFKSLAHKLGLGDSVVFTGFVPDDDLPYLYNISHIYIGAGAAELQGIAVMEAMATGLPVLAANAVALPELVKEGENGYLFTLAPADLADKMRMMLSQPESWQGMGEKSLAYIQVHDTLNALSQLEDLYREVIRSASNVSIV